MKALITLAMLAIGLSTSGNLSAAQTPPDKVLNDLNERHVQVPVGTVVRFCFNLKSNGEAWSLEQWQGEAIDLEDTKMRPTEVEPDYHFAGCAEGTNKVIEFKAFRAGRSAVNIRHANYDVPVGELIPMADFTVEITVTP